MASEREAVFLVPLPRNAYTSLKATWGLGNQLFTYASSKMPPTESATSGRYGESSNILDVRWSVDMYGPVTRKLVNESHSIFVTLQGQVTSLTGPALHAQIKKASKKYRSVLKACSLELLHKLNMCEAQEESKKRYFEDNLQLLEMMQLVWNLCEILYIDISPGEMVLTQLLDWLRWHFPGVHQLAQDVLNDDQPDSNNNYWEAVYRLLLQGEIESVQKLLSLHSSSQTAPFLSVEELLRKMPQWGKFHSISLAEFGMKWRYWQEECVRRYEDGQFSAFRDLETVVQILCGEVQVFSELREMCGTWYHFLISRLLYQNPTITPADLGYHVQACIEEFQRAGQRMGDIDKILQAALEFDLHQVIKDSSTFLSSRNWWFGAHLTDILHHCGQIDSQTLAFGSNLREYLLLEYASGLMSHHSLWQVGVEYLDFCHVFGKEHLKLFIENIPLDTERKALKLLHICQERDLQKQAQSICKVMGMRCSHDGRLGSALTWFLRSKDVPAATHVTEKFLEQYKENGSFSDTDLLDHLGPVMLLTSQLTFLGKYREFHRLYQEKDLKSAASLLLSLLTARVAPRHFWVTLLMDALPFLETPQLILSTMQTYEMMHCLEELTQELIRPSSSTSVTAAHRSSNASTAVATAEQEQPISQTDLEKLKFLRLALSRNLSRAIVQEGTITPT
ncbi:nuclear pore complex protein Nup85-like [Pomacea canaliculata]|uniref:nuclear pore complex protein Nup85-like n=1 Tax=Pomacea canaliculata TaxID=400727 RepID=UPI000D73F8E7|nr:nuclear pore complex protein Nup85-like [Pomacea canaliculata]